MGQELALPILSVSPDIAGQMIGIPRSAVYEAIAAGDLPSFKAGKRRLILVKELEAYINRLAKECAR